jgi:hypothetical protein
MMELLLADLKLTHLIKIELPGGGGHVVISVHLSTMLLSQAGTV